MTTAIAEPSFTLREWARMLRPTRDHSYQSSRLGADVTEYLAWKRLSRASARTLDQYERDLARLCKLVPKCAPDVDVADLMLVLEVFPPGSWKRVRAAWGDFFKWTVREGHRPDNPVADRLRGEWFVRSPELVGYFNDHGFSCSCDRAVDAECFIHGEGFPSW